MGVGADPDSMGDLEPLVHPLRLSFLICTMRFGLVEEFPRVTDSSSLRIRGECCLLFGDFDFQKPFALTSACTLPYLSFPGQFPLRPGTQL